MAVLPRTVFTLAITLPIFIANILCRFSLQLRLIFPEENI